MAVLQTKDAQSVAEQGSVVKVQAFAEKSNSASGCTKLTLVQKKMDLTAQAQIDVELAEMDVEYEHLKKREQV